MIRTATALLTLTVAAPALVAPALAAPLAAHRAVYDIELDEASERSGIEGMSGRMVYDFGGSDCDGYTTSFRFVTRIDTGGDSRLTDQQTTTFEDLGEGMFQFSTRSFVDQRPDRDVAGIAREADGETVVELNKPEGASLDLPETAFPTRHMIELLEAAEAGETLFERDVFDGSDDADRVLATTAVIGRERADEAADDLPRDLAETFAGRTHWPVSIAYYSSDDTSGEALPLYRIEFDLYDNGVTRDLIMDYGDFVLTGTLSELEMREADACE